MDSRSPTISARTRYLTVLSIVFFSVALDWITKRWAEANLQGLPREPYLWDMVRIQYAENPGAFLGMGDEWSDLTRFLVFTAATSLFLIFVAWTTLRHTDIHRIELIAVSLIIGGGIGNLIDRIMREGGRVVDFMNLGIGSLRTGIFNVADVALTLGVVLWIWPRKEKQSEKEEGQPSSPSTS